MSADLVWQLLRKNSSFMVRSKTAQGVEFSREKGNLSGLSSFKYSGLANEKAFDVSSVEGGVAISALAKGKANKPKSMWTTTELKRNPGRSAKVIEKCLQGYRSDMKDLAVTRLAKISKSQKRKAKKAVVA